MSKIDNVVALPGSVVPGDTEPSEPLIGMLSQLLAMAESGQLRSFIGTGFVADGGRLAIWADTHPNIYEQLGSLEWIKAEYIHRHTSASDE